jgi:hypothetical protein
MRSLLATTAAFLCVLTPISGHPHTRSASDTTVVTRWNQAVLQAVSDTRMSPPLVARALAIIHTSMYDAWAAYDEDAIGTRFGAQLRRPWFEHTEPNKAEAISHAAYRAAIDLFPTQQDTIFRPWMYSLGYTPNPSELNRKTPAGVGNCAASAVIAFRHHDGANQLGDLTASGVPYADYTGYRPANDALTLFDPNRWQPLLQGNGQPQQFLAPHWRQVAPFGSGSALTLLPKAPARAGTDAYVDQATAVVALSAALDDRTKAIAAYWADGPGSVTPPGHWMLMAQAVSARDRHDIDEDVKLFFAVGNALLDASIAAWHSKIAYDSIRPISAVRWLFAGQPIAAWGGPGRGTEIIDGSNWQPYIPTPPFAEHVSGHSTFSAAAAEVLRRFTGRDTFGMRVTILAGSSPIEPGYAPAVDVTLRWRTFSEAADEAGMSRRLGGIHFENGDLAGRALGRRIGASAWRTAERYFHGHGGTRQ